MQNNTSNHNDVLEVIDTQLSEQEKLLKELQSNPANRYLNAREAAGYIGISERLFNERLKLGVWTSYRVGRRRVFRPCDLDQDLASFKEQSRYRKS